MYRLLGLSWLLAVPLAAQPQIGGGTCSSATLSGIYAFTLTGRQVTSSGNFSNVFQGNGAANFDGLSKVTLTMTVATTQGFSGIMPLTWSGTYSIQSNCVGLVNITTGGSATLNIALYGSGVDFLLSGNDGTYSYSGSGNTQPSGCSTSSFTGVYTFTGTGFGLSVSTVNGVGNGTGLLQFDGQGNLTANITLASTGKAAALATPTGSYSLSANCLGSATLTDSSKNTYVMSFSVYSSTKVNASGFYATLAEIGPDATTGGPDFLFLISGGGHAIYGQPAATGE